MTAEKIRIKTPGFAVKGMVNAEQVASGMFAIHEKMPDDTWRTREDAEFPTPNGKGLFIPMERVLWPAAEMPIDYGDESTLFKELIDFFKKHEALRDANAYEIASAFTFQTYRMDEFSITPYLNLLGPRGTGKTRLMELLASVCYRGWFVTHPSPASVFYVVDRYAPTLLADNYEFWSKESRRELDGLYNAGYRRGAVVPRRPKDENRGNELEVYKVFCPKVISGTREPSEALSSRCIRIRTARASEPVPMFIDLDTAAELRRKLLAYRFNHFEAPMQIDESLTNRYLRVGEIFFPLLTIAPDNDIAQRIADFALGIYREDIEEDATSFDAEVVKAIADAQTLAIDGKLTVASIRDQFNNGREESERIESRKLGWALKRLGFKKARLSDKSATRAIELDEGLLEHLQRAYRLSAISVGSAISDIRGEKAHLRQHTPQLRLPTTSETPETSEMSENPHLREEVHG
jgi:hypothetical protein